MAVNSAIINYNDGFGRLGDVFTELGLPVSIYGAERKAKQ